MAIRLNWSHSWAFFVPVVFGVMSIIGRGASSKRNVSTVSVVRPIRDARRFNRSFSAEIRTMLFSRTNSERVLPSTFAKVSKNTFSSYVHLCVMLTVNFSDMGNTTCAELMSQHATI